MPTPDAPPPAGAADLTAEPFPVRCGGKTWLIAHPTVGTVGRLEILVATAAGDELDALRAEGLPPAQVAAMNRELNSQLAARSHRAGGDLHARVMAGPDGTALYLLALLRDRQPDATLADARTLLADAPDETGRAVAAVTPVFTKLTGAKRGLSPSQIEAELTRLRPWLARLTNSPGSSAGPPS